MGQGGFEVERDDGRLRMAGSFDFVVDLGQVSFGLAQQQNGCTVRSIGFCSGSADAATGAGHQNDPVLEQLGAGGIIKHKETSSKTCIVPVARELAPARLRSSRNLLIAVHRTAHAR
ncbi:hypothetical protein D3C81_1807150 [compost metagenome]